MKAYIKRLLLKVAFVALFLLLLFVLNLYISKKSTYQIQELPVRLIIPTINVNTNIQHLGITTSGEMEIPSNAVDVGWFKLGPHPGEIGNAVIAGHFNGENDEAGVFANLYKLKKGDRVYVKSNKGITVTFIVRETRLYDPGLAGEVFSLNDEIAHLNLVTCDGVWDGVKKSYSKRLVVFADISP